MEETNWVVGPFISNMANPNFNWSLDRSSDKEESELGAINLGLDKSSFGPSKAVLIQDNNVASPNCNGSEPIEVLVDVSHDGFNATKHTAVSFKELKAPDNGKLEEASLETLGASKSRTTGKIMGVKDGGFRATKRINKNSHGKGNFLKIKNSSKIPLRDFMAKLAQSVSIGQNDNPGAEETSDGCASSKFIHAFREYKLEHNPDTVCLLELRKARCDWLQLSDRNTNFIHCLTLQRRKSNRILALRDNNEEWCSDQSMLSDEATRFFENLYGEIPNSMPDHPLNIFSRLKKQDINFLNKPILNIEIKKAFFDMAPLKAPGSDGFHAYFFQSQWDLVGGAAVMYKLVMKVIANRFKVVFPGFISPEQAGFIVGRSIFDNVIIAQEVIHSMRSKKASRNWMAIKLDLEKAYDRINWEFIDASLVATGIPTLLRKKVSNLERYLGIPLLHDRVTKSTLNFLVDKVRSKLQNWEARKLSFARRVTLVQSVLLAIPNYFMQSLLVPKGVCDEIERIARQFIWGGSLGRSKTALVGWDSICQPKACRGLGFRHLHDQNNSFLMKIRFNLVSCKDALWVRVLHSKYGWKSQLPSSIHRSNYSHLWQSLSKVWPLFYEKLMWSIGDGSTIRGWKDIWIPKGKRITWSCLFGLITWKLWKNMNLFIFQAINWTAQDILKSFLSWAQHFESFLFGKTDSTGPLEIHQHCSDDWVLLFIDGVVVRASGNGFAGGVVHDRDGKWILGFTHYLGRCSPMEAEI
ncbi:hypothetical protein J1N35_007741 [Gossypium stocksii]|uniref:Reverse transcriptase domain-containing protein n=1 Tax=Gossypium stocksii TaxID=47602 RepID=A0A9D3W937_9ROSI|nr:hypothetical protein J1N35_007741 [Gossypium stocksii]